MALGVHDGCFGVISGVSTALNWTIQESSNPSSFAASNAPCGNLRTKGIVSWSGSWTARGALPAVMPGATSAGVVFYSSPDDGVKGGVGYNLTGDIWVESVQIDWNWETGEHISHTVNFRGSGPLQKNKAAAAILDVTAVLLDSPCEGPIKVDLAATDAPVDWDFVKTASLNISSALNVYSDTSTISGGACTEAVLKGVIDWNLAIAMNAHELKYDDVGTELSIVIPYNAAGDIWELKYGYLEDHDINVNMETGEIIGHNLNISMQGNYLGIVGSIKYGPVAGLITLWP